MRSKVISIAQTLIALLLILLCILAAQWQFHRGQTRAHQNSIISANQELPALSMDQLLHAAPVRDQWRTTNLNGVFQPQHQLLIRNRYSEGQLGFEVLTLFTTPQGNYWIDRGWVKAGANAETPPTIPALPTQSIAITGRIRSEDVSRQIEGSFFASLPVKKTVNLGSAQGVRAANFYLDLLPTNEEITPLTSIDLPELSNGPHYAYALQWLFFALIIAVGRVAIYREKLHRTI